MSTARALYREFRSSSGRIRVATILGMSAAAVLALLFGVLPALAGAGTPSGSGVQPDEVKYGGGSGACQTVSRRYWRARVRVFPAGGRAGFAVRAPLTSPRNTLPAPERGPAKETGRAK